MADIAIPTIYCSFSDDNTNDTAFSDLVQKNIFDFSFCEDSIYTHKFETIIEWVVYIIKEHIQISNEDLLVVCNSELKFLEGISNSSIIDNLYYTGCKGAQLLLGGVETARDLYRVSENLLWTDIFCHSPFIVIYKAAFKRILHAYNEGKFTTHPLELFLSLNLDYKFLTYPFIAKSFSAHKTHNDEQTWYNYSYSHYYEGIENQIKTLDEMSKVLSITQY